MVLCSPLILYYLEMCKPFSIVPPVACPTVYVRWHLVSTLGDFVFLIVLHCIA